MKHLKYIMALSVAALTACQTTPQITPVSSVASAQSEPLINATEVVAVVNTQVNAVDLEQKAAEWGYSLKKKEKLDGLDMYVMTFDCPPGINPHEAVVELERLQDDSTVSVNHKYSLSLVNSTPVAPQPLRRTYADNLIEWPEMGCDARMTVGIIDGGISDDLLQRHKDQITYKSFVNGKPSELAVKHGSAIASILTDPKRLNKGQFYIASVVSEDDKGQQFSGLYPMLRALDWMAKNDVKLVNISLAGPKNKTLEKAIKRAADKGMIIVAAVGNDGVSASPRYPAAFDEVIAATAVNKDGHIYEAAVRGEHVDLSAPGVSIYVPGKDSGRYVSGTSIAAPFVTAMIASHSQNVDGQTVQDVMANLMGSTQDLGEDGRDPVYGLGLIKAHKNCAF